MDTDRCAGDCRELLGQRSEACGGYLGLLKVFLLYPMEPPPGIYACCSLLKNRTVDNNPIGGCIKFIHVVKS